MIIFGFNVRRELEERSRVLRLRISKTCFGQASRLCSLRDKTPVFLAFSSFCITTFLPVLLVGCVLPIFFLSFRSLSFLQRIDFGRNDFCTRAVRFVGFLLESVRTECPKLGGSDFLHHRFVTLWHIIVVVVFDLLLHSFCNEQTNRSRSTNTPKINLFPSVSILLNENVIPRE